MQFNSPALTCMLSRRSDSRFELKRREAEALGSCHKASQQGIYTYYIYKYLKASVERSFARNNPSNK